ncbi:hypothetical protein V6N11_057660 [Hibiscus sabdariffa]|uniref:Uncharacterized protein n=2 Tax=Hibiscus sabdariffa TaxID=183260 RepID=A0ABR2BEM1_9ROSI
MLHVVYRVGDLEKTIKFYTDCFGTNVLGKRDIPEDRYSNAFLGYGREDSHFAVELTYNYGVDKYDIRIGFGHFGIAVDDASKPVDLVKEKVGSRAFCQVMLREGDLGRLINFYKKLCGGTVFREPGRLPGINTKITARLDPDGRKSVLLIARSVCL